MAPPPPPPKIAFFYRFYFLYCEPISAFLGGIGTFVAPNRILEGTTPASLFPLATATPNPLTKILITNIGALYILFAWNQFVVLRVTKDLSVWRALMLGMILCDVGHLYALFNSDPTAFVSPWAFRGSDWINEGTLWLGLLSRLAFVAGVGVSGKA